MSQKHLRHALCKFQDKKKKIEKKSLFHLAEEMAPKFHVSKMFIDFLTKTCAAVSFSMSVPLISHYMPSLDQRNKKNHNSLGNYGALTKITGCILHLQRKGHDPLWSKQTQNYSST